MRRFIQGLISRNIELGIADSKLQVRARKGMLTVAEQQTLKDNKEAITEIIRSGFGTTRFIASNEQARLWKMNLAHIGPSIFNIAIAARVPGVIDKDQLDRAITTLCQSVPILRSSFREVDADVIIESNVDLHIACETIECRLGDADHKDNITAFIQKPFNISTGPLFRIGLINEDQGAVLAVVMHHLIGDMASLQMVLDRVNKIYHNAGGDCVEPLHVPFYVSSENSTLYWKETLKDIKPFTQWYQQPIASIGFQGDCHYQQVPAGITERIFDRCKVFAVTPTVLLLTALQKVLQYATGERDFTIGIPVDTRFDSNKRDVIGFYSRPLPLREQVSNSDTFSESLSAVHKSLVEAVANRQITTRDIGRIIGSSRRRDRNIPAFQVLFNYLDHAAFQSKGFNGKPDFLEINRGMTDMDLFVNCISDNNRLVVSIEYRSQLFSAEDISLLSNGFIELLDLMTVEDAHQWAQPAMLEHTPLARNNKTADSSISIAATFTCEPIVGKMRLWTNKLGYDIEYAESSYGQVIQSLLLADSVISTKGNLAKVILIRSIDWVRYLNKEEDPVEKISANSKEFVDCLLAAANTSTGQFFVGFCPHDMTGTTCTEVVNNHIIAVERKMIDTLSGRPNIHCISSDEWFRHYPCEIAFDTLQDKLGHIPFSEDGMLAIATLLVRRLLRASQPLVKVLVVDCDNTLWKGVIGDDGVSNIELTDGYKAVQEKATEVAGSGVLICLCSKNNEQNISEYFSVRHDSVIKPEHITAQRINWESKSSNIRSLARELDLGLDSFVFLDDSSIECAEVRANCPEVLTLQLPSDEVGLKPFMEHLWVLDTLKVTDVDRKRVDLYKDNAARKKHEDSFADYSSFLASLDLKISFTALSNENVSRAAQMTQRTNQFNATTIRRTEAELYDLANESAGVWLVEVSDRFGDYGLVGELIIRATENALVVDTFLLSCRVLGRGVEHEMVRFIGRAALESRKEKVLFNYRRTVKNDPILGFFNKLGAEIATPGVDERVYELPALNASMLTISIDKNSGEQSTDTNTSVRSTARHDWSMTETISLLGADLERISAFLSPHAGAIAVQHNDEVLDILTSLWAAILQHTDFTLTDDFFSVGGDSLGLVQLLSAIKKKFGIELPIDNFVVSCTIAGLHDIIEHRDSNMVVNKIADPNEDVYVDLPGITELERFASPAYENILLTGATGFLGAFILKDLVLRSQATIWCHVRAASDDEGFTRIKNNLQAYGLWSPAMGRRIRILPGDLSQEKIGVADDTWQMMCKTIDCVIHNASDVNFSKSYAQIRKVNVTPVRTLLNFCGSGKLKPFNYVSTAGVFAGTPFTKDSRISEGHALGDVSDLVSGYLKSKWVAEQIVGLAKEKDYPVFIYRPGNISGDHHLGRTNVDNFFLKFTQAIVQDGTIPNAAHSINLVPVNFVSDCIVRLSLKKDRICRDYNLVNPRPLNLSRFTGLMKLSGYPLEVVDTGLWVRNIAKKSAAGEYHPLQAFLPLLDMPQGDRNILDAVFSIPRLPMVSVHEELGDEQLSCPPVGMELMQTYVDYFDKHALLEPTKKTQERAFISFKENMYGFGSGIGDDYQKGFTNGMLRGLRIETYTDCRIKSLSHLLRDKKVTVSGKVICDYLSEEPLTIVDGYWEIRPLKGVNVEDPDKQIIIEHNYIMRSQEGDAYHFHGKKTTAAGLDLLKETTTLYVTIRKDNAQGQKMVKGIIEVDMVEFVRDQVFNIEIDERVNANDQLIVKGIWLSIVFGNIATQNIENNFRWLAGTFFNDTKVMNSISQLISTFRTK